MVLSHTFWRRVTVAAMLGLAFVIMASVFSPDRSEAHQPATIPLIPRRPSEIETSVRIPAIAQDHSANAHEGLYSLGTIETNSHLIQIYSSDHGPRYSIYDRISRQELGTLLTAEQVEQAFPQIALPTADFAAPTEGSPHSPLMIAEPVAPDFSP